jgi:hypothetical protein
MIHIGPESWQWGSGLCVGGWVVGIGGCIAECAHPLEKSDPGFVDASIHRLSPQEAHIGDLSPPIHDDPTSGLPEGYHLDLLSDPGVIILRRPDETVVARFTPFADPKEIRRAAEEDRKRRAEVEPDG